MLNENTYIISLHIPYSNIIVARNLPAYTLLALPYSQSAIQLAVFFALLPRRIYHLTNRLEVTRLSFRKYELWSYAREYTSKQMCHS